jgi:chemotaxis family two-component system response regulator PixG
MLIHPPKKCKNMKNTGTFTKLSPQGLLRQLSNCYETTCLQVYSNSVSWLIYIEQGKIIYGTHSVEPFDRLERQIRRLYEQIPLVDNEVRVKMRLIFESESNDHLLNYPSEYEAINWLITEQYLITDQAKLLIQELVKEVIESFILIKSGTYQLTTIPSNFTKICQLNIYDIVEQCQNKLQNWRYLSKYISSPYQRPYLLVSSKFQDKRLPPIRENITNWMKGFSLRHLAIIINQDELRLALSLYPYIVKGSIVLHEPDPPFDKLPKISESSLFLPENTTELIRNELFVSDMVLTQDTTTETPIISNLPQEDFSKEIVDGNIDTNSQKVEFDPKITQKIYKIISVDDSPAILKEISRYLENENFNLVTINEPVKAVMSIIRHKPDLILLDLNMAGIDGYELCRIIRNNSLFKNIPIIFVTSNKGIIDKVKARFVGASGYLTKPFTRTELLNIIFMHLV